MWLIKTVAFLHTLVYLGIMWRGWMSYRILRNRSWLLMGMGFFVLLVYRAERLIQIWALPEISDLNEMNITGTLLPFLGALLLLVAFWKLSLEMQRIGLRLEGESPSGARPVAEWEERIRRIVSEEIGRGRT